MFYKKLICSPDEKQDRTGNCLGLPGTTDIIAFMFCRTMVLISGAHFNHLGSF